MTRSRSVAAQLLLAAVASCATEPLPAAAALPGFFHRVLHGFLVVASLIGSIFLGVRIHAFSNSGFRYDAGFVIRAGAFFGGAAGAR